MADHLVHRLDVGDGTEEPEVASEAITRKPVTNSSSIITTCAGKLALGVYYWLDHEEEGGPLSQKWIRGG